MRQSAFTLALEAFVFLPLVRAGLNIKPYSDGQCEHPITDITSKQADDTITKDVTFDFGIGTETVVNGVTMGDDNHNYFPGLDFHVTKSAKQTDTNTASAGQAVYWSIQDVDHNCRAIVMRPYSEAIHYGDVGLAPGDVIINVNTPGCYYSQIPVLSDLLMTFCCGSDDCEPYAAGLMALTPRDLATGLSNRSMRNPRKLDPKETSGRKSMSVTARAASAGKADSIPVKRDGGSTCKQDDKVCRAKMEDAFSACTTTISGSSFQTAGKQTAVSPTQMCNEDGQICSIDVSTTFTTSTEVSTSQDESFTTSNGVSWSVSGGSSFPVTATAEVGGSYEVSQASSKSTGQTLSNSTAMSVSQTLGAMGGGMVFATFTPVYTCYYTDTVCPSATGDIGQLICTPDIGTQGAPEGTYNLVYTN